jgi:hypothetical protein
MNTTEPEYPSIQKQNPHIFTTEPTIDERLHELLMNFVGAYESFDEIPEAREQAQTAILALISDQVANARIEELTELDTFIVSGTTIFGLTEGDWNDKIATLNGVKNK